jgi:predicted transcriptional regulator
MAEDINKQILHLLKRGSMTTSEISYMVNRNYATTLALLEQLKNKNFLIKIPVGRFKAWRLNNATE